MTKSKIKAEVMFKSEKKKSGTLKAFQKIRALLSDKNSWMKGDFEGERTDKKGNVLNETYCLLGAVNHIDGPFEDVVKAVMVAQLNPDEVESNEDALHYEEEEVMSFNDATNRKHSEILNFLDNCIKVVKTAKIHKEDKNKVKILAF